MISSVVLATILGVAVVSCEPVHEDVVAVLNVASEGINPGGVGWSDSYSIGASCYCRTTFDHDIGDYYLETPFGWLTTRQICELLGPGPGLEGNPPVYNDVQCGNGPPNDAGDEHVCPGRVDIGQEGCGHIGPTWNFANVSQDTPVVLPSMQADAHPDIVTVLNVRGLLNPTIEMASSYSVDGRCYCMPKIENGMEPFFVQSELGWKTVQETCDLLGQGPQEGRIYYNDVQCGRGPPSAAGDEQACPGRVDIGDDGCGHIGPKWSFEGLSFSDVPSKSSTASPTLSLSSPSSTIIPTSSEAPSTTPTRDDNVSPTTIAPITPSLSFTPSSEVPSEDPSGSFSDLPSDAPTSAQTDEEALSESSIPSDEPSFMPSFSPSAIPSILPTASVPSVDFTNEPMTTLNSPSPNFHANASPTSTSSGRPRKSFVMLVCHFIYILGMLIK